MPRTDPRAGVFDAHAFADPSLLHQALTHRSAGAPHNERLEFLGDAVLGVIVSDALYARWPKADEGSLTRARAELVRESSLAAVARELDLGPRLVLGAGELKSGGHRRDSILSDALEAVFAAVYLDAGLDTCRDVVLPLFEKTFVALAGGRVAKDAKTRLQEWLQGRQRPLPVYELVSESGDDHAKLFLARCTTLDPPLAADGEGTSRRNAEQVAAAALLDKLDISK